MAKQEGMIIVRGAVGNISYRRTGDGFQVGLKSKLNRDNVLSDKAFEQTRLVNREFGTAGKAGKLIRDAIMIQLKSAGDGKLAPRMQKILMQALKQDTTSDKGDRRPEKGELGFLNGFEFNKSTEMQQIFLVQNVSSIDRASGKVHVDIPDFTPSDVLMTPDGATHFRLVSAGCELDFPKNEYVLATAKSDVFSTGNDPVRAFSLETNVTAASTFPIILVLGIRFYQLVNGKYLQLPGDKYNAMRLLKVDQP